MRRGRKLTLLLLLLSLAAVSIWLLLLLPLLLRLHRRSGGSAAEGHQQVCVTAALEALRSAGWSGHPRDSVFVVTRQSGSVDWDGLAGACSADRPDDAGGIEAGCFVEKLERPVRERAMRHLGRLAEQLERAGVEFYLDMGSALGALRHFEMIPYDEDIDLRISEDQKEVARRALNRLRLRWPEMRFHDTEWINQHWKVHLQDVSDPVLDRHVAIDIFFYRLNRTTGQLIIPEPPFSFPIEDIFPTVLRPFHRRWYPTPNSIGRMIAGYFPNTSLTDCVYYLHDLPFQTCTQVNQPCRRLASRFGFTETLQMPHGQLQLLRSPRNRVAGLAFIAGASRL